MDLEAARYHRAVAIEMLAFTRHDIPEALEPWRRTEGVGPHSAWSRREDVIMLSRNLAVPW